MNFTPISKYDSSSHRASESSWCDPSVEPSADAFERVSAHRQPSPSTSDVNSPSLLSTCLAMYHSVALRGRRTSSERSAGPQNPPVTAATWEAFEAKLQEAKNSREIGDRENFLTWYSDKIAPHLQTEEAALQILAQKLSYLWMTDGFLIDICIKRNLSNKPVYAYSKKNRISKLVGINQRISAYLIAPDDLADKGASIITFAGTNIGADRDYLMRIYRSTGVAEDLGEDLGQEAFEELRDGLQSWVRTALSEDRPVIIIGHSLGGALATLLTASLSDDEKKAVRLVLFCPAGVSAAVAKSIPEDRVRLVYHEVDPVVLLSGTQPRGTGWEITDSVASDNLTADTHSLPYLALNELRGRPYMFRQVHEPANLLRPYGERGRSLLTNTLLPLLQALNLDG